LPKFLSLNENNLIQVSDEIKPSKSKFIRWCITYRKP